MSNNFLLIKAPKNADSVMTEQDMSYLGKYSPAYTDIVDMLETKGFLKPLDIVEDVETNSTFKIKVLDNNRLDKINHEVMTLSFITTNPAMGVLWLGLVSLIIEKQRTYKDDESVYIHVED